MDNFDFEDPFSDNDSNEENKNSFLDPDMSYNKVFLIGRLIGDPEYRLTPSGIAVTKIYDGNGPIQKTRWEESSADFI